MVFLRLLDYDLQKQNQCNRVCYFILIGVFLASKGATNSEFISTAADGVPCGGLKRVLVHHPSAIYIFWSFGIWGWSGGAMVLGKLPVPWRPTILITVGQGPIALAVGAVGGGLDILLSSILSLLSPSLWETARYRLEYCLKRPLNPKQPTNIFWDH